jgi:hypothetical protein
MSITPNVPTPKHDESMMYEGSPTPRWIPLLLILLFLGLVALGYEDYESHTQLQELQGSLVANNAHNDLVAKQIDETNSRAAQLRGQLDVTSRKLGLTQNDLARANSLARDLQKQQEDSDAKLGTQIGQVQQESDQKIGQVNTDLSGAKTDITSTQKDLADTKAKLTSTVGDLGVQSGLIARTQADVEALRQLGDRNIFDFNMNKTKEPQHIGPIQAKLVSTDPKHFTFSMTLIADDKTIEKKDRNVDEPMQFYVSRSRVPYEIVVFEVSKDRVTGYLSTPKDNGSAAAPAAATTPAATNAPAKPKRRLFGIPKL